MNYPAKPDQLYEHRALNHSVSANAGKYVLPFTYMGQTLFPGFQNECQ